MIFRFHNHYNAFSNNFNLVNFANFIQCQFQPLSEPFILAAYDPDYSPYDDNKIMNQNIQRFGYNKTKVILSKHINTTNIYLEGRILDNSSYQIDATLKGMFIRVDKFTHRLKLCPNGKTSKYFSIEKICYFIRMILFGQFVMMNLKMFHIFIMVVLMIIKILLS